MWKYNFDPTVCNCRNSMHPASFAALIKQAYAKKQSTCSKCDLELPTNCPIWKRIVARAIKKRLSLLKCKKGTLTPVLVVGDTAPLPTTEELRLLQTEWEQAVEVEFEDAPDKIHSLLEKTMKKRVQVMTASQARSCKFA